MRAAFVAGLCALTIGAVATGCGGGGNGGNPTNPSPSPSPSPSATTINIVGQNGAQSFNPNPASAAGARMVVWRNSDGEVHRIVANDGSFDTGNIGPGASSAAVTIPASGARYHCSLHTNMVGAVNETDGDTPPCSGLYC
jgi:plastocyanin